MTTSITYQLLEGKKACTKSLTLFKELFPNGAPLTIEVALSVADKFDWSWAARNLLSVGGRKAYNAATALAWKVYLEADDIAWKAYKEAVDTIALKAYKEATALALKAYKEAKALAFATAYLNDQQ